MLGHTQMLWILAAATVDRDVVSHRDEAGRYFAKGGLESSEVELRERHTVQPKHPDSKPSRLLHLPDYINRDFQVAGTSGESISIGRW